MSILISFFLFFHLFFFFVYLRHWLLTIHVIAKIYRLLFDAQIYDEKDSDDDDHDEHDDEHDDASVNDDSENVDYDAKYDDDCREEEEEEEYDDDSHESDTSIIETILYRCRYETPDSPIQISSASPMSVVSVGLLFHCY